MGSSVELQGVEQMLESIRSKLSSGVTRVENEGLRAAGEILAAAQRDKVAVSTIDHKHIRDDIRVSNVRRGDGIRYITVGPGKETAWRARFLEDGTRNMSAQPFIYPAAHENKALIAQLLASYYRRGMRDG